MTQSLPAVPRLCWLAAALLHGLPTLAAQQRPNVVLVITDDQGYGDIGAHGNEMIRTPNLDQLAADSVRFTDYHVDPTCSPSRSALLTGRYSSRTGVWHTIMGRSLMAGNEQTMAEVFGANGYRTAMLGKWHLGDNAPCRPQDQGFDHVVWHHGGGVGQGPDYWGNDYFDDTYEVNGKWREFEGYCTDVWFEQAAEFVQREDARPFFLYLATNAPHHPYLVDESYSKPYLDAGVPPTMANFYGMITNIDDNVGRLRTLLAEQGLADNTVFVFTTDNGTAAGNRPGTRESSDGWQGWNAGMRGKKGSEYDGGHRVPLFVHWPNGGVGGGRDVDALSAHIDVLPTLVELCALKHEPELPVDGVSFASALRGKGAAPRDRILLVHSQRVEHPKKWRKSAVMSEQWRLVNGTELFDIQSDPAQAKDVADGHPEVVAQMRAAYETWWTSLQGVYGDYVRIDLGGSEDPAHLMSHDWHTDEPVTPWHQNHVRNGFVGNGAWAVEVQTEGSYDVELRRWPAQLERAMDCTRASLSVGGIEVSKELQPEATVAVFRMELPKGPAMLDSTLLRADDKECGAYFVTVRKVRSSR